MARLPGLLEGFTSTGSLLNEPIAFQGDPSSEVVSPMAPEPFLLSFSSGHGFPVGWNMSFPRPRARLGQLSHSDD